MHFLDYLFLFTSTCGCYAVGLSLVRAGPVQTFILGLALQGLLLGVSVWFVPNLTTTLIASIQLLALLFAVFRRAAVFREHCQVVRETFWHPTIYLTLLASITISMPFSLSEYPFNSHDPVYWGFVIEALQADYSGRLQSPILSPLTLPVTHLLPMMSLTVLIGFIPTPTLITVIGIKHLLVILFFWRLSWTLLAQLSGKQLVYGLFLLGSLFFIFESELGYNLLVSSFLYEVLLLEIAILLIAKRSDLWLVLLFALTLAVARGPLAYAALGASAILAWHLRSQLTPVVGIFAALVSANILTWLTLPKPFAFFCNEAALSVVNPFSLAQFGELSAISQWALPSSLTSVVYQTLDSMERSGQVDTMWMPIWIVGLFFSYAFLKFFLPIIAWLRSPLIDESNQPFIIRCIGVYLLALWVGMFVVRIGGSADHQFHAFLLLSVFAFFVLFHLGMHHRLIGLFLVGLGLYGAAFDGLNSKPFSAILTQGIARERLTYEAGDTWSQSGPSRLWHTEIKLLASGQRRSVTDLSAQEYLMYFKEEPSDLETIASLWVVPEGSLRHQCDFQDVYTND